MPFGPPFNSTLRGTLSGRIKFCSWLLKAQQRLHLQSYRRHPADGAPYMALHFRRGKLSRQALPASSDLPPPPGQEILGGIVNGYPAGSLASPLGTPYRP